MVKIDKKRGLVLLFLLFFTIAIIAAAKANAEEVVIEEVNKDITSYESLVVNLAIKGDVYLTSQSKLTTSLFLFPIEDGQDIIKLEKTSVPLASIKQEADKIVYDWNSVTNAKFEVNAEVKTKVNMIGYTKVPFPVKIAENLDYTKPSENIDSDNKEIIAKANEIVAGKTDSLDAVLALANFVHSNIRYDDSYVDIIKKASWVLQNKAGVCDEFTNLFIALCRSIGIPARYVSGSAYSNTKNNFGNHAWAEVWLPGQGWIPFDATYGQQGWIDATHLALAKTIDTVTSVTYSYLSNAEIDAKPLSIKASVKNKLNKLEPKTETNIRLLKNNIKAGQYTVLEIDIKNLQSYYMPLSIYLTKAPGVNGENTLQIILKPNEARKEFFILNTGDISLIKEGYSYEGTIEVKTSDNSLTETTMYFSRNYDGGFSLNEAEATINMLAKQENEYSYAVSLSCAGTKSEYYTDEEITAVCKITNDGNVLLKELNLCAEKESKEDCRKFDLAIGSEKSELFVLSSKQKDYIIKLQNDAVSKSEFLGLNIFEKPNLTIVGVEPKELDYSKGEITLTVETKSICKDAVIKVNNIKFKTENINLKKEFPLELAGKNALAGKISVKAECSDLRGNVYKDSKTFDVKVNNIPALGKIWQVVIKIFAKVGVNL